MILAPPPFHVEEFNYQWKDWLRNIGERTRSEDYIYIRDEQPSDTDSGTFTGEGLNDIWTTRVLNTIVSDDGNLASLASNQITLAPGVYRFYAVAPAFRVERHKLRLFNNTDSIKFIGGSRHTDPDAGATVNTIADVKGRFEITAPKVFEVQHHAQITQTNVGLGIDSRITNTIEVYAEVEFWKEK